MMFSLEACFSWDNLYYGENNSEQIRGEQARLYWSPDYVIKTFKV